MNTDRIDMRVVLGIALGGIPAVLIAAYAVTILACRSSICDGVWLPSFSMRLLCFCWAALRL
jgi:hypothetical protein